ncbi:hypothetical protein H4Q26_007359 [Puccinia striiformis f. sp. tritici PST-130]|nr:hypothetical protein H4Q26_007359 [Puccinia striiformis f. sp. tritici PST-130]
MSQTSAHWRFKTVGTAISFPTWTCPERERRPNTRGSAEPTATRILETARAVQHFHSPLTALSAANQRYAVYLVLRVIIRHAPWRLYWFWETVRSSDRFKEICKLFNQDDFFQKVNSLSDALSKTPHQNHLSHDRAFRSSF